MGVWKNFKLDDTYDSYSLETSELSENDKNFLTWLGNQFGFEKIEFISGFYNLSFTCPNGQPRLFITRGTGMRIRFSNYMFGDAWQVKFKGGEHVTIKQCSNGGFELNAQEGGYIYLSDIGVEAYVAGYKWNERDYLKNAGNYMKLEKTSNPTSITQSGINLSYGGYRIDGKDLNANGVSILNNTSSKVNDYIVGQNKPKYFDFYNDITYIGDYDESLSYNNLRFKGEEYCVVGNNIFYPPFLFIEYEPYVSYDGTDFHFSTSKNPKIYAGTSFNTKKETNYDYRELCEIKKTNKTIDTSVLYFDNFICPKDQYNEKKYTSLFSRLYDSKTQVRSISIVSESSNATYYTSLMAYENYTSNIINPTYNNPAQTNLFIPTSFDYYYCKYFYFKTTYILDYIPITITNKVTKLICEESVPGFGPEVISAINSIPNNLAITYKDFGETVDQKGKLKFDENVISTWEQYLTSGLKVYRMIHILSNMIERQPNKKRYMVFKIKTINEA